MLTWLAANWGTLLVAAALGTAVYCIVRKLARDKRAGRHSCGGNCGNCGSCGACAGRCGGACGKP